ncbi:ras-related C3 botulinum toxin substrate 1-like [Condylostylus longicornis]|uniref:ras-related C3 botulinum toxin substrate 1-like n=1 Tax=Condylostylus longicornis TaxID=2530218 RepID=UPI00244DFDDD|nr:ras-related C3 botulinum toxin substrate 1-like [Condylostylus longicornis]
MKVLKCTVVGDVGTGKTSLLVSKNMVESTIPAECVTNQLWDYPVKPMFDGKHISLEAWDKPFPLKSKPKKPLQYSKTDIFLLCFSIVNIESFKSIKEKWYPHLNNFCPKIPIILIGIDSDLRNNENDEENYISYAKGLEMAKEINAIKYLECSILTKDGLNKISNEAMRLILNSSKKSNKNKKSKCFIM